MIGQAEFEKLKEFANDQEFYSTPHGCNLSAALIVVSERAGIVWVYDPATQKAKVKFSLGNETEVEELVDSTKSYNARNYTRDGRQEVVLAGEFGQASKLIMGLFAAKQVFRSSTRNIEGLFAAVLPAEILSELEFHGRLDDVCITDQGIGLLRDFFQRTRAAWQRLPEWVREMVVHAMQWSDATASDQYEPPLLQRPCSELEATDRSGCKLHQVGKF